MEKIKQEEFKLRSIKTNLSGGYTNVEYGYLISVGNKTCHKQVILKSDVPVHSELWKLLQKQKPNVLNIEEIDYRLMSTSAQKHGADSEGILSQIAEGMTQDAMSKIEITGIKLSGSSDNLSVVITYKKIIANKSIEGRSTGNIKLKGDIFGFEQELAEDIEEIKKEAYGYVYKGLHSDSAQGELWKLAEDDDDDDQTEPNTDPEE